MLPSSTFPDPPNTSTTNTTTTSTRPAHHANDASTAFKNPWPSADPPTLAELASQPFPLAWSTPLATLRQHPKARPIALVEPDWGRAQLERERERNRNQDEDDDDDDRECLVGTWLGHASALVSMPLAHTRATALVGGLIADPAGAHNRRLHLLFDPIFSTRAGPTQWTGPRRFLPAPCRVADLPGCDVVLVSHNHYDHLDLASVTEVARRFPMARWFVPLGNKRWLVAQAGVRAELVDELDWWGGRDFWVEDFGVEVTSGGGGGGKGKDGKGIGEEEDEVETRVRVTCVPAQHNSGRAAVDSGASLWCGWAVEQFVDVKKKKQKKKIGKVAGSDNHDDSGEQQKIDNNSNSNSKATTTAPTPPQTTRRCAIYHAGDTGYRRSARSPVTCPVFRAIGTRLGPFDLSFVPIWRGGTLGFVSSVGLRLALDDVSATLHGSPADAVCVHRDVRSRHTVGVHFGTFVGSENETLEAVIEFGVACEEGGVAGLEGDGGRKGEEEEKEGEGGEDGGWKGRAGVLDIGASLAVVI